jgi:flagellar hook-basal body complex protein FliE
MSLSIAMLSPNVGSVGEAASPLAPKLATPTGPTTGANPPSDDFAQTLASMASDAVSTIKAGEATAMAGMKGEASLQQVVQAVMLADQTLQTVVAVRDKVVGAYLEISRMQI